jgi:hypothetical protein
MNRKISASLIGRTVRPSARETGAFLIAAGGLTAAFGVAFVAPFPCCSVRSVSAARGSKLWLGSLRLTDSLVSHRRHLPCKRRRGISLATSEGRVRAGCRLQTASHHRPRDECPIRRRGFGRAWFHVRVHRAITHKVN